MAILSELTLLQSFSRLQKRLTTAVQMSSNLRARNVLLVRRFMGKPLTNNKGVRELPTVRYVWINNES